jgi:hypothetical protein
MKQIAATIFIGLLVTLALTPKAQANLARSAQQALASNKSSESDEHSLAVTLAYINSKISVGYKDPLCNGCVISKQTISYKNDDFFLIWDMTFPSTGEIRHGVVSADLGRLGVVSGSLQKDIGFAIAILCKGGTSDNCAQLSVSNANGGLLGQQHVNNVGWLVVPDGGAGRQVITALRHLIEIAPARSGSNGANEK